MNLTEAIEYLKNTNATWYADEPIYDPNIGAYILPNFFPEKYLEYEQDYAELVKNVRPYQYVEYENGIIRIGTPGVLEFFDETLDEGSYEIGGTWEGTSKELADYIIEIERIFSLINDFNKKVCQKCDKDYAAYNSDCFEIDLFLRGNCEKGEGMLRMDVELMKDDDGLYNGKLSFEFVDTTGTMFRYFGHENDVTIPANIKTILGQAFLDTDVERISIPDGVKCYVSAYAFEHCKGLKYVYFGSDVEVSQGHYVGNELFINGPDTIFHCCDALERIEVSPDNPYISSVDGKLYNKDKTKLLYDPADKSWWEDDEE